jgi:hypothetical protein
LKRPSKPLGLFNFIQTDQIDPAAKNFFANLWDPFRASLTIQTARQDSGKICRERRVPKVGGLRVPSRFLI